MDAQSKYQDVKVVSFAFPNSPNAIEYGYPETGCWNVDIETATGREVCHVASFACRPTAFESAAAIPLEYGRYSVKPFIPEMEAK